MGQGGLKLTEKHMHVLEWTPDWEFFAFSLFLFVINFLFENYWNSVYFNSPPRYQKLFQSWYEHVMFVREEVSPKYYKDMTQILQMKQLTKKASFSQ